MAGVTKRFGSTRALDDVSLEVGKDELFVVLGPTGAGKTTLLRTIAGLERPDAGRLELGGQSIAGLPPAERDVALVFQNFSLYPQWTVRQNLEFPLRAPSRRLGEDEIRRRVEWAAGLLRISELLDRDVSRLSGGEMQRVTIGRAIVRRPRIFLMDEPLSNLDAKLREVLRVELVCLRRELGVPMIFVTHDQAEALSMGDRIAVLAEGRILQVGTPETVYRRPATPAVALQLGQPRINLFQTTRRGGHWVLENGATLFPAEPGGHSRCVFGIRAENIAVAGGAQPGTVSVVEEMGPHKILLLDWLGQPVHVLAPATAGVREGETVYPLPERDAVVAWPGEGGMVDG
ncbi:MAG: ABC transporter ATP-binding protein [Kiritimatiellae bacterium]|nr:ABC transporter ATP-binding protein [Kiritimatiellia bacterium]